MRGCLVGTRLMSVRSPYSAFYADASAKGARFLTEPIDREAEVRCYMRNPDGYLIEVGQAIGMLRGVFADPPAGADG